VVPVPPIADSAEGPPGAAPRLRVYQVASPGVCRRKGVTTMRNASRVDRQGKPGFPYSSDEVVRIMRAVRNEGYPPQGRTGVGSVLRNRTAV